MARHDEGHGVAAERRAHGTHGPRMTDLLGHPGIGPHLAEGNAASRLEDAPLEVRGLRQVHGNREERALALEILVEFFPRALDEAARPRRGRLLQALGADQGDALRSRLNGQAIEKLLAFPG